MPKKKKKARPFIEIDGQRYTVKHKVLLCRASQTMTEAQFSAFILSGLRRLTSFIRWKPARDKLLEGRRPSQSANKRLKWEYHCEQCLQWFPQQQIEVDHITNCGGISGENWMDKIKPWIINAFVEIEGYQRLCKECHQTKTKGERNDKSSG